MNKIILASGSPRRREILEQVNLSFVVDASDIEEIIDNSLSNDEIVMSLAKQKAMDVAKRHEGKCVIGSDTVVVYDKQILGKPKDDNDALNMLKMLSGKEHSVFTGVAIVFNGDVKTFYNETKVKFYSFTDDELKKYVNSKEPHDKAGAYGIQGLGSFLVEKIDGDYFSVMGLPISKLLQELKKIGITI